MKYFRFLCLCMLLFGSVGQAGADPTLIPSDTEQHQNNWENQDDTDCTSEPCEADPGESDPSEDDGEAMPCPPEVCDNNGGGARNPVVSDP